MASCNVIFCLFNVVLICVGKVTKNIQIMAHFGHKKKTDSTLMMLSVRWRVSVSVQMTIGPWPMHEVVLMAVRKAVSAATITFTANSMMRCFFIRFSFFFEE